LEAVAGSGQGKRGDPQARRCYAAICGQLVATGAGLGLLVPPLTSALLGSVEKSRSGLAAGVLNATRQTGSALGVALFGSLIEQSGAFVAGARASLIISAVLLVVAGAVILFGASRTGDRMRPGGRN
jgi:DHA2 family methylenomycin A resistance protein-like MFS transporter